MATIPVNKTTEQNIEKRDEVAADSGDSQRTMSGNFEGIPYCGNQEKDVALEADSAMVLPAVTEKEARSDSERTLEDGCFVQIVGYGSTDDLHVDSASSAKRPVVKLKSSEVVVPLEPWLKKIDSGRGIWTATKWFRSDEKHYDRYYCHKEYDNRFRSKPEVEEFLRTGTVKGKVIKKRSGGSTTSDHDYGQATKRRRTGAAASSNTAALFGDQLHYKMHHLKLSLLGRHD